MRTVRTVSVSLLVAAAGACGVLGLVSAQSPAGDEVVVVATTGDDDTHWTPRTAVTQGVADDDTHWVAPVGDDDTHW
jgi:hypothetical protein